VITEEIAPILLIRKFILVWEKNGKNLWAGLFYAENISSKNRSDLKINCHIQILIDDESI
jgi:hypothetical protein